MSDPQNPNPSPEASATEPEPQEPALEGVVEVQGQKLVPVSAVIAERDRARTSTEKRIREEYEPVKAKAAQADQLAADLGVLQPYIDHLRRHPELMQQPAQPDVPSVSDQDAEQFARQYELYTPTGLDTGRAKKIIANQREDMAKVARSAAQEAVAPMIHGNATQQARQNFLWAASQRAADGTPLVDANELAQEWANMPPELAANPEVAQVLLDRVIGRALRSGKRVTRPDSEPTFSEPAGGRGSGDYKISPMEQRMARATGVSEKDWAKSAKEYQPDSVNILGD